MKMGVLSHLIPSRVAYRLLSFCWMFEMMYIR